MLESKTRKVPTLCRICLAHCGVLATITDGKLTKVEGDPDNPMFKGYCCPKGRAIPDMQYDPKRLLASQKRQDDGSFAPIPSGQAIDEIAVRLSRLIAEHGPRSVAMYQGTSSTAQALATPFALGFLEAIGSPMFFTPATIDQPGKLIALALHGYWMGGDLDFEKSDSWILVGTNPVISKAVGVPSVNPGLILKRAQQRGMKLVVIDPRESETAKRAALHIQPRPGEDASILAAILNVIISEGLYDKDFVAENVAGFNALAAAVAPFTPEYAAKRAGVPAQQMIEAAHLYARADHKTGMVNAGTGPNFTLRGNIIEYLALCITTVCGAWGRAGQPVNRPNVLLPAFTPKAQPAGPFPAWGFGEKMRVRDLGMSAAGLPVTALPEEILMEGEGQVKALICMGSNPMAAWPDQRMTQRAMEALDLLVCIDVQFSQTARLADYVIAPKVHLETPGTSYTCENIKYYTIGFGFPGAYGQYSPPLVQPPEGADVIEEWEFYHGLAKRMDLDLHLTAYYGFSTFEESPPLRVRIGRDDTLDTQELHMKLCSKARIPIEEVAKYPHGHIFDVEAIVEPRDPDCTNRLDIGNPYMMDQLAGILKGDSPTRQSDSEFRFRLVCRRHNNFMNSSGTQLPRLNRGRPFNPTYMHPDDIAALGLASGDSIAVSSRHDAIPSILQEDVSLRRGVIAMHHAFGGLVDDDDKYPSQGSNIARLICNEAEYDPITGIPRMSDIPVNVTRAPVPA
ncbi:MAG: molybdopterin-dependent oxidoreductase [Novosphingobium sp.]|nr:molybdopterin-dependent oxidoreductase [Novosphingobium sp.]